jgi:hypothetical protein
MRIVKHTVETKATPIQIWKVWEDAENWKTWDKDIVCHPKAMQACLNWIKASTPA